MRVGVTTIVLSTLLLIFGSISASAQNQEKSLYQRLGGYDAISAVTDDLIGRLVKDKRLGKYFVGLSNDSKKRLRQHLVDFLCAASGGPCVYTGRDMKTSHQGLGINEEDWDIFVKLANETFDKFKVPQKERTEVLTAVGGTKKDIVENK